MLAVDLYPRGSISPLTSLVGLSRAGYTVRELPTLRCLGAVPLRVRVMEHPVTSLASA